MTTRKFTTPTFTFTLKDSDTKEPLTDLVFDYMLLTLSGNNFCFEKEIPYSEYDTETAQFKIKLTQEETGQMPVRANIECMVNIMIGEDRVASNFATFSLDRNLHNAVIDDE